MYLLGNIFQDVCFFCHVIRDMSLVGHISSFNQSMRNATFDHTNLDLLLMLNILQLDFKIIIICLVYFVNIPMFIKYYLSYIVMKTRD